MVMGGPLEASNEFWGRQNYRGRALPSTGKPMSSGPRVNRGRRVPGSFVQVCLADPVPMLLGSARDPLSSSRPACNKQRGFTLLQPNETTLHHLDGLLLISTGGSAWVCDLGEGSVLTTMLHQGLNYSCGLLRYDEEVVVVGAGDGGL